MILTLPTVQLAAGVPSIVALSQGADQGQPLTQVKIANESPWPLVAQLGADQQSVPAWTADLFPLGQGTNTITLTPQPIVSATAAYSSAAAIVTVGAASDQIPGTYPAALVRAQQQLPSMCKLAVAAAQGSSTIFVDNPSALTPGGFVWIQPPDSGSQGQGSSGDAYPVGYINPSTGEVFMSLGLGTAYEVGALVINVPFYVMTSSVQPIAVEGPGFANVTPVQIAPFANGWNVTAQGTPSSNPFATVTYTPPSGQAAVVTYGNVQGNNAGATAYGNDVVLSGSVSGVRWRGKLAVTGTAGAVDRCPLENNSVAFAVNEVVTLQLGGTLAAGTTFVDTNLSGYLVG